MFHVKQFKGDIQMKEDKTLVMRENLARIASIDNTDFRIKPITPEKLFVKARGKQMRVIVCKDMLKTTQEEIVPVHSLDGFIESDTERDLLKIVVIDTSQTTPPAIAFLKGTGLKLGAVAESVANEHHQIIAVGATDFELMEAINTVIRNKGGIAVTYMTQTTALPHPSTKAFNLLTPEDICRRYEDIEKVIKTLHTPMESLLTTLAYVGISTEPSLRLSDKGLFDSENRIPTSLFI